MTSSNSIMESELQRFIAIHKHKLFPNTPIEVRIELGAFCIYVAGEWRSNEPDIASLSTGLNETLELGLDYWPYPSLRDNPSWEHWSEVSTVSVHDLANVRRGG
jgi:hypothetical protein